jgi:single-strand DNA-binding protein
MVNKVLLVGRIATEPDFKYTPGGVAVCNFRIAVDREFKNGAGEVETDFIDVQAWRASAEFVNNYLGKGRLVYIDGRIQVRQWENDAGEKRRSVEVVANRLQALDRPREDAGGERTQRAPAPARAGAPAANPFADPDAPTDVDDPFADQ